MPEWTTKSESPASPCWNSVAPFSRRCRSMDPARLRRSSSSRARNSSTPSRNAASTGMGTPVGVGGIYMLQGQSPYPGDAVDARVAPLYEIFKFNTRNFLSCLDGMNDDQAGWRAESTNSAAYIALHLVDSRHFLARATGVVSEHRMATVAKQARLQPESRDLPSLEELRTEWKSITGEVRARLGQ